MSSIFDYDNDLISEIYDMLDDDTIYESNDTEYTSVDEHFWSKLAPCCFLGVFSFCYLGFSLRWCKGLIRFTYAVKAFTLLIISLSQLGIHHWMKVLTSEKKERNHITSHALPLIHESLNCFYLSLSLTMLHELYVCTCRIEVRELKLVTLFHKAGYGMMSILVAGGLHTIAILVINNVMEVGS